MLQSERPAYRVLDPAGFYGDDDHLYPEGDEIYFDGEPNEMMEPLNAVASERLLSYLTKLDDLAKDKATKLGQPFIGRPRTLDGAIMVATKEMRDQVSIMGAKGRETQVERFSPSEVPETGREVKASTERRGRGRPAGSKNKVHAVG